MSSSSSKSEDGMEDFLNKRKSKVHNVLGTEKRFEEEYTTKVFLIYAKDWLDCKDLLKDYSVQLYMQRKL
jgi:hypothetical protein